MEAKTTACPVLALGKSAASVAQSLKAQMGEQMDLYAITEDVEGALQIIFPHEQPWRFLLYNRAEVAPDVVKRFGTAAKIGGSVIGIEIAVHQEAVRTSWQMGTDILLRTDSERACQDAAAFLLRMAFQSQPTCGIDFQDVVSLFAGTDHARIGMAEASGKLAKAHAIADALREIDWRLSSMRGLLVNISGSEEHICTEEMEAYMDAVMDRAAEDGNMMWGVSIDPALGDTVQVTVIATRGWKREGRDACDWISRLVEVMFHDNDER